MSDRPTGPADIEVNVDTVEKSDGWYVSLHVQMFHKGKLQEFSNRLVGPFATKALAEAEEENVCAEVVKLAKEHKCKAWVEETKK